MDTIDTGIIIALWLIFGVLVTQFGMLLCLWRLLHIRLPRNTKL